MFFIVTANSMEPIPSQLLDCKEVICIPGYIKEERFAIGVRHLPPQVLEAHGLTEGQLEIYEGTLRKVIEKYTRKAGVRNLKKQLAKLARVASQKMVSG